MTDLKIIQDELSNLQPGWIILLETEPNLALEVSLKALKLLTEVIEKRVDEAALSELEKQDSVFPRLDFRVFASVSKF